MTNNEQKKPKCAVGDTIIVNRTQIKGVIENVIGTTKVVAKLDTGVVLIMHHDEYQLVQVPKKVKVENLRALIDCALLIGDQGYFIELTNRLNAVLETPEDPPIKKVHPKPLKKAGAKDTSKTTEEATKQKMRVEKQLTKEKYLAVIDLGLSMRDYALVDEYRKLVYGEDV